MIIYVYSAWGHNFFIFVMEWGIEHGINIAIYLFPLRYARTFIFFYSIGLHLLVFTLLYRMSALSYLK